MDDLTEVVMIEDVSNVEALTGTGMNTADAYIGLMGMDTELPFMSRRRLSMNHHHRASPFFYLPSLFAERFTSGRTKERRMKR